MSAAESELENEFTAGSGKIIDLAACGGVHTTGTGEVGLIKYKGQEKVRGRIRLFWLIGERAYRDYRLKTAISDKLTDALSVPVDGIEDGFERLVSQFNGEKKKNSDLLKEMAFLKAEEIANECVKGK